ncbi:hypothetical protein HYV11_01260 [Candidatus Dependentiae bacterium]|nr:hypothetical protein [Candidatus Dependentiae bacterium]
MNKKNKNYIVCKKICFYSQLDEDMFFLWIKSMSCVKNFYGAGDKLYIDLVNKDLDIHDMKNLIAFLYRYKIDMTQLQFFVNEKNESAAQPWKKQIYKQMINQGK